MCKEIHFCDICGKAYGIEDHHIVFKSECKPLDKCPFNHVYLCEKHHRDHKYGVHFNKKLNKKYKSEVKEILETLFEENQTYSTEEIQDKLQIGANAARSLCKLMWPVKGKYKNEDIIKTCLGGNYTWEED